MATDVLAKAYPLTYKAYWEFYENEDEVQKTQLWEECKSDTMVGLGGTITNGLHKGMPLFQVKKRLDVPMKEGGLMVRRSRCNNYLAILPQNEGLETDPVTPCKLHHIKNSISPDGIMSPCHVIVIPNPNRSYFELGHRYANALTLEKHHLSMLDRMEELLFETINMLIDGPAEMIGSLRWWLSRKDSDMVCLSDGSIVPEKIGIEDFRDNKRQNFLYFMDASKGSWEKRTRILKENMRSSFHLSTRKINWLNMHGWIEPLETLNLELQEMESAKNGNEAQTPVSTIRMFIHSGEVERMKLGLTK